MSEGIGKGLASLGICAALAVAVYVTKSAEPLWGLFILAIIW